MRWAHPPSWRGLSSWNARCSPPTKTSGAAAPSTSSRKSFRGGSRGPETGVRGIPSPFIKIYERGRDTPHPSLPPLLPPRKDFLDEVLGAAAAAEVFVGGEHRAFQLLRPRHQGGRAQCIQGSNF